MSFIVAPENRDRYGLPRLEIVATNNPTALFAPNIDPTNYTPCKFAAICANEDLSTCWERYLGAALAQAIQAHVPRTASWVLNALRLGFDSNTYQNPVVIQLTLDTEDFLDEAAHELLVILQELVHNHWHGNSNSERVFIDVCKIIPRHDEDGPLDQSVAFASLYKHAPPLPGSSIGTGRSVGTLTGYIKHTLPTKEIEVFALTCRHVVDPIGQINTAGALHRDRDSIVMSSPSLPDHEVTKLRITEKIEYFMSLGESPLTPAIVSFSSLFSSATALITFTSLVMSVVSPVLSSTISVIVSLVIIPWIRKSDPVFFWSEASRDADGYSIKLGEVSATSGSENMDWALIPIAPHKIENINLLNMHFPHTPHDQGSGFPHLIFKDHFTVHDMKAAVQRFKGGPPFLPILESHLMTNDICFKPPSRTIRCWIGAEVSRIAPYIKPASQDAPVTTFCLVVAPGQESREVSKRGDSGSVILSRDFRPAAILWGGLPAALGVPDVTYVTPVPEVFAHIEKTLAWDKGSVAFC